MDIAFRNATAEDAARVCEVLHSSREAFLPYACLRSKADIQQWTRAVLIPAGGVTVAVAAGAIVGVVATAHADGMDWITQLYVAPEHVGQGIGARLLSLALGTLARPVRLWCFQRNTRARRFYERRGFEPIRFTDGAGNEERCPDVLYELS